MRKQVLIILAICVFCSFLQFSLAEEPVRVYESGDFSAVLPSGDWYQAEGENGSLHYYDNPKLILYNQKLVFAQVSFNLNFPATDGYREIAYDSLIHSRAADAVDGKIDSEDSMMAGVAAKLLIYDQEVNGIKYTVVGNYVLIDDTLFAVCCVGRDKSAEEIMETVISISETVEYSGEEKQRKESHPIEVLSTPQNNI